MKRPSRFFKDNICYLAIKYYSNLAASYAAVKIYQDMTDEQYKACCRYFPTYEEDYGDAAVAAFTRWIRKDRKLWKSK